MMASAGVASAGAGEPGSGPQEIDTCRICRGEGSAAEPLFHPCKCSGSIMYVHQDCLMEWLSHSQKKHCELCKTSFTFTKLYHPNMPPTLPTRVFLRKATAHVISKALYWARGTLVALTWLFWLPWTMRFVWWGLFWLADMGWVNDVEFLDGGLVQANLSRSAPNPTAAASAANLHPLNPTPRPGLTQFLLWLFDATAHVEWQAARINDTSIQELNATASLARVRSRDTLLSGVPLFTHPVLDRIATDVLEGLVITVSLVAAIVLVLLIREWVVQQQPIINMGVDDDAPNPLPDQDQDERDVVLDNAEDTAPATPEAAPGVGAAHDRPNSDGHESTAELLADLELDPSLVQWEQLASLCGDAARASAQLKQFQRTDLRNAGNWNGDVYATERCASLILKFHETLLALAEAEDRAEKDADRNTINEMQHKLALLENALHFFSDFEADKLKRSVAVTKSRVEDYLASTPAENDGVSSEPPRALLQSALSGDVESSPDQPSDQLNAAQTRPSMPGRGESSLATGIQRRLQESVEQVPGPDRQTSSPSIAANDPCERSNSDEGWQEIHTPGSNPATHGESSAGQAPAGPAEARHAEYAVEPLARSNSFATSQSNESVDFDRPLPRAEFWSRRARPHPARPQSVDHFAATDDNTQYQSTSRRASSSCGGLEGQAQNGSVPEQADGNFASSPSNSEGQAPLTSRSQGHNDGDDVSSPAFRPAQDQPSWYAQAVDWVYGDVVPSAEGARYVPANDEHVVDDIADEEPFVPVNAAQDDEQPHDDRFGQNEVVPPNPNQAVARPALVPNEAELIDEAEELEGVLELIGMQGPITGLFTNALFAAVFVSCTTTLAVWLPFLTGKLVLVGIAHPITLGDVVFKAGSGCVNLFVDFCIFTGVYVFHWFMNIPLNWVSAWKGFANNRFETPFFGPMSSWSLDLLNRTYGRLSTEFSSIVRSTGAASSHLTLDSHIALSHIKGHVHSALNNTAAATMSFRQQISPEEANGSISVASIVNVARHGLAKATTIAFQSTQLVRSLPQFLWSGQVTLQHTSSLVDAESVSEYPIWSTLDRSLTITIGYIALGICAGIYFTRIAPIATTREGRKMENMVLEILQQTGGISKVVLIISIEMLAFPLYCGLLLDIATLPLFGFSSIDSRMSFTVRSPWTSAFVHWFIGTCYMFHFALFVAMCRKILRKGVLYFIRDPDDPTFHPVRDVLERSVASQLRKIMSSAMIYGGLVIVCLGSVLWLLAFGISGILPIKWTSESNFLGFPIDLVIYTTLKPVLVRFVAPSDWMHQLYTWWFKRSARVLRLSHYLFGYDNADERGQRQSVDDDGANTSDTGHMSGRWVRVPNNDQVRIGKGKKAWTEVDENNHRQDGKVEPKDVQGVGPNDPNFVKVYIPPFFRLRIALFFASLWVLTAVGGFALTVLPLLCGRSLFAILLPKTLWANDIYAFSIGLLALGAVALAAVRLDCNDVRELRRPVSVLQRVKAASRQYGAVVSERARRVLRCVYVYGILAVVMPCVFALLGEVYILGPLHTWLSDGHEAHTVQLLRSWTLGVQYVRVTIAIIQWSGESTAARAFRAVTARGYLNPDAGKATRYFFLPAAIASAMALLLPIPLGMLAAAVGASPDDEVKRRLIRSLAFPAILATGFVVFLLRATLALLRGWQMHIRDEVYLIGERLHNYGERVTPKMKTS